MAKDKKIGSLSRFLYAVGKAIQFRPATTFAPPRSEEAFEAKKGGFPFLFYRKKIKNALAKMSEQSFVLGLFGRFYGRLFNTRVRSFGVLFFTLGFLQILSYFLGDYLPLLAGGEDNLLFGVFLIFLTLLCSFSRGDLKEAIKKSFLYRALLKPLFGIKEEHFPSEKSRDHLWPMILVGALLAFFSVLFSPAAVLGAVCFASLVLLVFHLPEAGLLCSAAFLFVLPSGALLSLAVLTLISFLFKCAVGKRSMVFSPTDALVLAALLPVLFSREKGGISYFISFFGFYFLASCLLRGVQWIKRFFSALSLGGIFCSLMICLRFGISLAFPHFFLQFPAAESIFFVRAEEGVSALIVILCPLVLGRIRSIEKGGKALMVLAFFSLAAISLFATARAALWIPFLASVVLFLLMSCRGFLLFFSLLGLSLATVIPILPSEWIRQVLSALGLSSPEALSQNADFLSVMREQFGFFAPILFLILIAFVIYRCFRFAAHTTLFELFPLVLGTLCAVLAFLSVVLLPVALNEKVLFVLMFLSAIPEAAFRSAKREEIRLPY